MQVGVFGMRLRFRGGDGARVHLGNRQGGGLCCAARCRGCSTHSRPQVTSAGAKPNHAFFNCQQPAAKKFRPAAVVVVASGRSARARERRRACVRSPADGITHRASREKRRVLCGLCKRLAMATLQQARFARAACGVADGGDGRRITALRTVAGKAPVARRNSQIAPKCARIFAVAQLPQPPIEAIATTAQPRSSPAPAGFFYRVLPPAANAAHVVADRIRFARGRARSSSGNESGRTWRPELERRCALPRQWSSSSSSSA
jgi:hypothetical protein